MVHRVGGGYGPYSGRWIWSIEWEVDMVHRVGGGYGP